jgi:hypothetical protein
MHPFSVPCNWKKSQSCDLVGNVFHQANVYAIGQRSLLDAAISAQGLEAMANSGRFFLERVSKTVVVPCRAQMRPGFMEANRQGRCVGLLSQGRIG